jgi:hypothetical protein
MNQVQFNELEGEVKLSSGDASTSINSRQAPALTAGKHQQALNTYHEVRDVAVNTAHTTRFRVGG